MKDKELQEWLQEDRVPEPNPYLARKIMAQAQSRPRASLRRWALSWLSPKGAVALGLCLVIGFVIGAQIENLSQSETSSVEISSLLYEPGMESWESN